MDVNESNHSTISVKWAHLVQLAGRLALPVILIWGLLLRLWDIAQPFIGDKAWNDVYYAYLARHFIWQGNLLRQYDIYSGAWVESSPLVPWLVYGSFSVFGQTEWAARLPLLGFGIAALLILYKLTDILYGHRSAILATLLAATAPGIVFFSRTVQLDGVMTTLGLGAVLFLILFRRKGRVIWLLVSLICFAVSTFTKYTAVLFLPVLAWCWFEGRRSEWRDKKTWVFLTIYVAMAMTPTLIWLLFSRNPITADGGSSGLYGYLFRFQQWTVANFASALLSWTLDKWLMRAVAK